MLHFHNISKKIQKLAIYAAKSFAVSSDLISYIILHYIVLNLILLYILFHSLTGS